MKIDWVKINTDWNNHWRHRPTDYDIREWFDKFWDDRGGRDRHFCDCDGEEHMLTTYKES